MGPLQTILVCFTSIGLQLVAAQCPNLVAAYNQNLRTQSINSTWFLVPVPKVATQDALNANYGPGVVVLADVPSSDKSLFPNGFSEASHPVLVTAGCE